MDEYTAAAAAELRAAQARAQLSDIALAERAGIPVVTLRRYLKGTRDTPSSALFKIAFALDMTIGELLDEAMKRVKR
ncbi:helix-turn-helix domain-containing protein [Humibacter ginsenosidimutans]|nr:helix-turn-helix transcriptional regulator [Humibacter ginsenosidimutans]